MPTVEIKLDGNEINVIDFIALSGLVSSKSEIRRLINQQGILVDDIKVNVNDFVDLKVKEHVLKKGKKVFLKVVLK